MTAAEATCDAAPFFLDGQAGRLFALSFEPAGTQRGSVLYCPPFAEEMNKSRRQVALTARRLAAAGQRVLLVDLYGTGDSEGDFADATWANWLADLRAGVNWLVARSDTPLTLWGLRLGAHLALDLAALLDRKTDRLLLWQPVPSGKTFTTQFLRLRIAAELTRQGPKTTTKELRSSIAAGQAIEVSGYQLSPGLFAAINQLDLAGVQPPGDIPISWIDIVPELRPEISLASQRIATQWSDVNPNTEIAAIVGEPFWSTVEIAVAQALIDETERCIAQ
jgi:exosortase A-associated hydrolase 2